MKYALDIWHNNVLKLYVVEAENKTEAFIKAMWQSLRNNRFCAEELILEFTESIRNDKTLEAFIQNDKPKIHKALKQIMQCDPIFANISQIRSENKVLYLCRPAQTDDFSDKGYSEALKTGSEHIQRTVIRAYTEDGEFYGYLARHPDDYNNDELSYYTDRLNEARKFSSRDDAEDVLDRVANGSDLDHIICFE